jgi:Mrp family chromosome partitioning ATPase
MVTSADVGDGKTTTAAALAAAFAEGDEDVVLLDFDVRRSGIAGVFGLPRPGDELPQIDDDTALSEMLIPAPGFPHLKVLPAPIGDAMTLELLMRQLPMLLKHSQRLARFVIVDTAPLGAASDALRIAKVCDDVVLVVRPRHTDRSLLVLARDLLARAGATPVGMVIVGQSPANLSGKYLGYGYAPTNDKRDGQWLGERVQSGRG